MAALQPNADQLNQTADLPGLPLWSVGQWQRVALLCSQILALAFHPFFHLSPDHRGCLGQTDPHTEWNAHICSVGITKYRLGEKLCPGNGMAPVKIRLISQRGPWEVFLLRVVLKIPTTNTLLNRGLMTTLNDGMPGRAFPRMSSLDSLVHSFRKMSNLKSIFPWEAARCRPRQPGPVRTAGRWAALASSRDNRALCLLFVLQTRLSLVALNSYVNVPLISFPFFIFGLHCSAFTLFHSPYN